MDIPERPAAVVDLTDAEFQELDELLARTPEPLEPLDAVRLDGFLCGVLVQPVLLRPEAFLPHVFDIEATPLPETTDAAWRERTTALILRRHTVLGRTMAEDGWFDPLILEFTDEDAAELSEYDPMAKLPRISQALYPWIEGFHHALQTFPDLVELPDEAIDLALARLYRHLPAEAEEEKELVAVMEREHPLATLDDAIDDLIVTVADLSDLTSVHRYRVEQVKRDAPKPGRNDACPCGSGKKFKHCHGAS